MSMPYLGHPRAVLPPVLDGNNVCLHLRQQPRQGLVTQENKEKGRKPIDPPPIIQMSVVSPGGAYDPSEQWLVSPYLFMIATLLEGDDGDNIIPGKHIIGQNSSSLHRLKDVDNKDGGFFVFGDLSVKKLGRHRIRFSLFNADQNCVTFITSIDSQPFDVVASKEFNGLTESSHLSRTFSDQGVRLRLRKEARQLGSSAGTKRQWESPEESTSSQRNSINCQNSDRHYSSYGTPSIKRHRPDNVYQNPYTLPHYTDNVQRYYGHNVPLRERFYGAPTQSYPQAQHNSVTGGLQQSDPYHNSHGSYNTQGAVQSTGPSTAQPLTQDNWSGAYQQDPQSVTADSSIEMALDSNLQLIRPNYVDNDYQHQVSGQYGAIQPETLYQTPTSMENSTPQSSTYLPSNAGHSTDAEPALPTLASASHQSYQAQGELDPWYGRVATIPSNGPGLHTTEASFEQTYSTTSRYPDAKYPEIATTTSSIAAQPFPYLSSTSSPLRTYATLGDSTLNSAYATGPYQNP